MYIQLSAIAAVGVISFSPTTILAQTDWAQTPGYMDQAALDQTVGSIVDSSEHAWSSTLGQSIEGRPIYLITLAGTKESADSMPAMLISAGLDGRHLVGTETAIRIAQRILAEHSDVLDSMTIYIVPRVNPDGAELNLASLTAGAIGNARATDDDRDRASGEDGPDDLNGDGLITMMRRLHPPIEHPATHLADPDDPRLNIKPDTKEGQRASFTLYTEGIDNDGDGEINEDGAGYVNLDQNFMHRWPEHATHAGRYQLSEPESYALARFVIDHDNIVMALTLGEHDNLINQPDSKTKDITGRAPKGIDSKDAEFYKHAGELFKEATGQKNAKKVDSAGSFYDWLYAQRGIPSFATTVWGRPEIEKDGDNADSSETESEPDAAQESPDSTGLTPSGIGDISQETIDELIEAFEEHSGQKMDDSMMSSMTPEMIVQFASRAGITVQRVTGADPADEPSDESSKDKKSKKKKKSEDAKWLEYFDQAGIEGFVDWQAFDHPTLGKVEIGGFVPLSRTNPPADQLDELGEKETAFVMDLLATRPKISVVGPEIKEIADGLYEVRVAIVNDGEMPTSTMYSQSSHTIRPIVMRISSKVDDILTGQRVSRIWGINANGGRSEHRWIIRTDDLSTETIEIVDPRYGDRTLQLGE